MPKASTLATSSPATVTALRDVLGVQDVLGTVNIFDDTTAGLAATSDGDYFSVPSAEDDEYLILYKNVSEVATEQKRYPAASRVQEIGEVTDDLDGYAFEIETSTNLYNPDERRDDILLNSSNGSLATLAGWAVTGFIPVTVGEQYTISADANKRVGAAFYSTNASDGSGYVTGSYNNGAVNASTTLTLTAPSGAAYLVVTLESTTIPEPSEVQIEHGSTATDYQAYFAPRRVLIDAAAPGLVSRISDLEGLVPSTTPKLVLGGGGTSYVQVVRNGNTIRRDFTAFPTPSLAASAVFNLTADKINGVAVKTMTDDAAPYRAAGATIGANHGYNLTDVAVTGHGKTSADVGSVWQNSNGAEYVILAVKDANTLRMVRRSSDANAVTGTYTHVSGATNTTTFSGSAVTTGAMWFAGVINREAAVYSDGVEVTDHSATVGYQRSVVIRESYDVLSRSTALEWFISNPGTTAVQAEGDPAFSVSLAHEFDHEGNYTLYTDFVCRADGTALEDIMFTQAQRMTVTGDGTIQYYVPKALPFTHEGSERDWAMIDTSDTTGWSSRADFTPARCEEAGILVDRLVMLSDTYGFAIGYLPVQDAAVDTRRVQVSDKALQISNSSGKVYLYGVDKGDTTINAGDVFSVIAYRNVFVRPTGRTCAYPVRTQGDDYFYMDWHDLAAVDRVPVPADFAGRAFEVVEKSDSVTLLSQSLTNALLVDVAATGSYGYLILKVT